MGKVLLIAAMCALVAGCSASDRKLDLARGFTGYSSAQVNDYADEVLRYLRPWLVQNNFDPFPIMDLAQDFWFQFIFNYTGHIELTNGWLQDISTIRRSGDSVMSYDHKLMRMDLDLSVDDLIANFDYRARFLGLEPDGQLTATITKQRIVVGFLVDLEELTLSLQQLKLDNTGKIDLHVTGLPLLGLADAMVNAILDGITGLFKDSILGGVENQIRTQIENLLSSLPPLLPPLPDDPDNPLTCVDQILY